MVCCNSALGAYKAELRRAVGIVLQLETTTPPAASPAPPAPPAPATRTATTLTTASTASTTWASTTTT